jgi:5-methylcytosine-specific restriction protein A
MAAIILGWNLERWNERDYAADALTAEDSGQVLHAWPVGPETKTSPGADAWLFLQDSPSRGLIGHGVVLSEPVLTKPVLMGEGSAAYVEVLFDALLPIGNQVPPDILRAAVPNARWDGMDGTATIVDVDDEASIREVWRQYGPEQSGDPIHPVPGTYPEEAVTRVNVIRFEDNQEARRACIAFHGTNCAACGFSYEVGYGEIGRDFIQVHHVVPVSQIGRDYELDPSTDLVPLCANCHAMAHRGVSTPRTVAELRRIIAGAGYLAGQAVDNATLAAQRDAQRILDQRE